MRLTRLQTGLVNASPVCLYCDKPLTSDSIKAKYCGDNCRWNHWNKLQNPGHVSYPGRPFVAIDGEGIEDKYILLAASNGTIIENRNGLTTKECLDFLVSLPRASNNRTRPIYVWFAFDYDVNMILGDIPLRGENGSIEELRATGETWWGKYRIRYFRRKILLVYRGSDRHTSYDVWSFFASTFEQAARNWDIEIPRIITSGKSARNDFSKWKQERIIRYNNAELEILVSLCNRLRKSVNPLKLPIQSWHGPGAFASAWLQKHKVKEWKGDINEYVNERASMAYFGGRIDAVGYGICSPVFHYDLVSAYPAAIAELPRLDEIKWRHGKHPTHGRIYLAEISWEIPTGYWMPFPWRNRQGTIRFPRKGRGWYWCHEIEAAITKFGKENFHFHEILTADGNYNFPFRKLIRSTFDYRNQLKRENNPSNIAVKLILNSLYGKFAQTVGKATYFSPIWAGLITSYTRSRLLQAITEDTVCVMTDSIWSRKPLDIETTGELGGWERQGETELILAEAGLYAASDGNTESVWQRGFDKRYPVDIRSIVTNWIGDNPFYESSYPITRFVGMGLALQTHQPWRNWVTINRVIHPVPLVGTTKRLPLYPIESEVNIDKNFVFLEPRPADEECLSYSYSKLPPVEIELEKLEDECSEESRD